MNVRNRKLQSPLHLAVQQAHVGLVPLLVDAGCSVNAEDEEGDTALHVALQRHQLLPLAADQAGGTPGSLQLLSRVRKCRSGCWRGGPWYLAAGSWQGQSNYPRPLSPTAQADRPRAVVGHLWFVGGVFCSSGASTSEILHWGRPGRRGGARGG